jgi:hypothetical protein
MLKSSQRSRLMQETLVNMDVVYYEEMKRELNSILIYECRCNERLRAKAEGSTRLTCMLWNYHEANMTSTSYLSLRFRKSFTS